ncbi:MAG TPA: HD-GYP domain-containing protein [Actinomycetota bacterium]|nr:HD-GYP domain-containing protein [Actinomycetota bacterium]
MTIVASRTSPSALTLAEIRRVPSGVGAILLGALIVALLAGAAVLISVAGGAKTPAVHVLYLPILLGAVFFKRAGGMAAAAAAALIVGPWMPLDTQTGQPQEPLTWLLRGAAFLLIGVLAGEIQLLLQHRLEQVNGLVDKIASIHAKTLTTLASTVELRDEPTGGHCIRVAHNARALGVAIGLEDASLRTVYWAGLLHDLGKTAIAERILQKPERLTEDEWTEMRRHSVVGAELLESVSPDFRPIAAGVRAHHERWDGTGYPDGLAGEEIPLVGRIVTVVDVFEALTCPRPYREQGTAADALAYLRANAGRQFDPSLVPMFEDLYWKGQVHTACDPRPNLALLEPAVELAAEPAVDVAVLHRIPTPGPIQHAPPRRA